MRANSVKEMCLLIRLENANISMELDTGCAVSLINEKVYREQLSHLTLSPSSVLLKTYTDEPVVVLWEITVNVDYENQSAICHS